MRSTPLIRALGIAFLLVGCRGTADPETPRSPDAAATATQSTPRSAEGEPHRFSCRQLADRYRIEIDGALFAEYVFRGHPSPIVYPVHGAHGIAVTRGHPMHTNSGEATDHPHHRSLWFAHGDINGHDFWHRGGRVEQRKAIVAQGSHGVVLTTHGPVQGVEDEGVTIFRGIPYAAPPTGPLRWQPPQDPACWADLRVADAPGSRCAQLESEAGGVVGTGGHQGMR